MAGAKILVVDDDPAIRTLIVRFLGQKGYAVAAATDGQSAKETFQSFSPDLVILDINLPDTLGYALCEQMQESKDTYVLILTSRTDATDKVRGFTQGADDYLTKPFDIIELEHSCPCDPPPSAIARCPPSPRPKPRFCRFKHWPDAPCGRCQGRTRQPNGLEFNLLHFLAKNANKVWRRSELIQAVWGYDYLGDQRVVDVHIGQIRRKLDNLMQQENPIKTVRGVGYMFETTLNSFSETRWSVPSLWRHLTGKDPPKVRVWNSILVFSLPSAAYN